MKSFILLLLCLFVLTGCQQLQEFADSVDRANETWSKASTGLADIAGEVRDALVVYEKALKDGDTDGLQKARVILEDAQARYKSQEAAVEATKLAVEDSRKQFEEAKEKGNYLWTIPGMILGGVLGAFGIKTKLAPALSALGKTASNIKSVLSNEAFEEVKEAQSTSLTTAEKKALEKALGH